MDRAALEALADEPLEWRAKGFPLDGRYPTIRAVRDARPSLFDGGFVTPVATLRAEALEHNLERMAAFCRDRAVDLAPHGKTTMAPQLFARQLDAGGWGLTVATPWQARVARAFGVPRLLLANELVDPEGLAWLGRALDADPGFRFLSYVDDPAAVDAAAAVLAGGGVRRPLEVLVEVGYAGGRTGCRDDESVDAVVSAVDRSDHHRLVGVSGYEGTIGHTAAPEDIAPVRAFLRRLRATGERLAAAGAFDGEEPVVLSAGGSAYFDLVTEELAGDLPDGRRVQVILRSGGYVSHDEGLYEEVSPFHRRTELGGDLDAALEVWTRVVSRPEPGLALLDAGRRDLPFDSGLPVPRAARCGGQAFDAPERWAVVDLNDQHAYLSLDDGDALSPGDLVALGISHPCTLFDKWTWLPVVSADGTVTDVIRTFF
jgi:D-serine deaminase-like pyridoxal phosphate-dependent protein